MDDRPRRHLRLVDRRHRLGTVAGLVQRPVELRRVHRRQVHHGQADVVAVVQDLRAQAVGEAAYRRLGAAIHRLQRHRAVGQRGAHVDDGAAAAAAHALECRHGAVHGAEIGHGGAALDLVRRQLGDRAEDGRHRVVDPHRDGPERLLDRLGGGLHRCRVGHVGDRHLGTHAEAARLGGGLLQAVPVAADQAHVAAATGERAHGGAADAGPRSGDDDDLGHDPLPAGPAGCAANVGLAARFVSGCG